MKTEIPIKQERYPLLPQLRQINLTYILSFSFRLLPPRFHIIVQNKIMQ